MIEYLQEHRKEAVNVLIGLAIPAVIGVLLYAANAWADSNYVGTKNLSVATAKRDLKDVNKQLADIELEQRRTQVWLRFLPADDTVSRQIYGAELDILVDEHQKLTRQREEAMKALETAEQNE